MKSFNEWYTKINEELAEPATTSDNAATAEPTAVSTVKDDRDNMISDIDTIMNSLETLAGELTESLNEEVNEADTEIGALTQAAVGTAAAVGVSAAFAIQKVKSMKARKNQKKANAMLMKVEISKIKARDIEDPNSKKAVENKIKTMEAQAEQLQQAIDDRYADEKMPAKAIQAEKLKGKIERIELLAKETGSDSYKKQIAKLNKQYQETITALDKIKKEGEEKAKATDDSKEKTKPSDEKPAEAEVDAEETKDKPADNSKEGKLQRLDALMSKAKESGDEAKIKKIQDLIDRVSAKESWQLDNTELGLIIEAQIVKLESEQTLFESRHNTLSIKERFSKLI